MDTELTIKLVELADIEALHQLSRKTFIDSFAHLNAPENMEAFLENNLTTKKLSVEINNPGSAFYFVWLNNQAVGYIKLNTGPAQTELQRENGLEIERIYVLSEHQGKKIGQFLFNYAVETAKKANRPYLWLGVWDQNHNAIRFYKRHGFVQFDTHQFALGSDIQTDIMMKLVL